jgi:hypothetical protein
MIVGLQCGCNFHTEASRRWRALRQRGPLNHVTPTCGPGGGSTHCEVRSRGSLPTKLFWILYFVLERTDSGGVDLMTEGALEPWMTSQETSRYRGYDIVPRRQWSAWCVSIYPTRPDLPIPARSTLSPLTACREDALAEARQSIDRLLSSLNDWLN